MLNLTADQVLTTTRSVRKRLDFTRPVPLELIRECLDIATQAPTGGNRQTWHFVVVTDPEKRKALGDIYRKGWSLYLSQLPPLPADATTAGDKMATLARVYDSSNYLAEHIHEAPVFLIPCIYGRSDNGPVVLQAGQWGSILPAAWSFMLAARERGLGSAWTSVHLFYEEEAAKVVGIPFAKIMQAALIPVAYTVGTEFAPAKRESLDDILHVNAW